VIAVVTILFALPLGYLVRNPVAAYVGYVAVYAWAFTYQGVYLMLSRVDGDYSAFPRDGFPLSYGLVTLGVYVVGFGLVTMGRWLRTRRTRSPERVATPA
jgi:hypothetical protein